jgi:hypothetical protein
MLIIKQMKWEDLDTKVNLGNTAQTVTIKKKLKT